MSITDTKTVISFPAHGEFWAAVAAAFPMAYFFLLGDGNLQFFLGFLKVSLCTGGFVLLLTRAWWAEVIFDPARRIVTARRLVFWFCIGKPYDVTFDQAKIDTSLVDRGDSAWRSLVFTNKVGRRIDTIVVCRVCLWYLDGKKEREFPLKQFSTQRRAYEYRDAVREYLKTGDAKLLVCVSRLQNFLNKVTVEILLWALAVVLLLVFLVRSFGADAVINVLMLVGLAVLSVWCFIKTKRN